MTVRIGSVVCGEAFAVARNCIGRSERATGDLKTDGAHRISRGVYIRDRVGNAVRAVPRNHYAGARVRQRDCGPRGELAGIADGVTLPFVGAEVKQLVLDDRPAERAAKLLQVPRVLRPRSHRIEVIARIHRRIAAKGVSSAVDEVCAGFQPYVYDGARLPAILRRGSLLNIEFLNRVNRKNRRRISRDAGSVDNALA